MAKILFIASGFPPYEFSENIINGKLVLALLDAGHEVTVLTKVDDGKTYSSNWQDPWLPLQPITKVITYPLGNKIHRLLDVVKNIILLKYPIDGVRWAGLAYKESLMLIKDQKVDVVITRSPSDIAHLVGLKLKKQTGIKWIVNWNDPATGIWPVPYEVKVPYFRKKMFQMFTQEVLLHADFNTFPSTLLSKHFQKFYNISTDKIVIIPHIIYKSLNSRVVESQNSLRICHSGNLSIERDPENLFKAIKKYNAENKSLIYIDILGVATQYSVELVKKYKLEGFVKFLAPLSYAQALKKMAEYDVLMIVEAKMKTSIFLPSKITDYVQLSKPILSVSPESSEVANLINEYGGGVVASNMSVDDIYNKLHILNELHIKDNLHEIVEKSELKEYLSAKNIIEIYNKYLN